MPTDLLLGQLCFPVVAWLFHGLIPTARVQRRRCDRGGIRMPGHPAQTPFFDEWAHLPAVASVGGQSCPAESLCKTCLYLGALAGGQPHPMADREAVVMRTPPLCPSLEDPSTELSTGSAETSMTVLPFNTIFNSYFVPSLPQVFPRTPSSDRPVYRSPPLSWLPSAQSSPSMG